MEYELTDKGLDYEKIFNEMRVWGMKWLMEDYDETHIYLLIKYEVTIYIS